MRTFTRQPKSQRPLPFPQHARARAYALIHQGLAINQFEETPGGQPFLEELGFASPYQDWWSLIVLFAMVSALRLGLVVATRCLTFEKR